MNYLLYYWMSYCSIVWLTSCLMFLTLSFQNDSVNGILIDSFVLGLSQIVVWIMLEFLKINYPGNSFWELCASSRRCQELCVSWDWPSVFDVAVNSIASLRMRFWNQTTFFAQDHLVSFLQILTLWSSWVSFGLARCSGEYAYFPGSFCGPATLRLTWFDWLGLWWACVMASEQLLHICFLCFQVDDGPVMYAANFFSAIVIWAMPVKVELGDFDWNSAIAHQTGCQSLKLFFYPHWR